MTVRTRDCRGRIASTAEPWPHRRQDTKRTTLPRELRFGKSKAALRWICRHDFSGAHGRRMPLLPKLAIRARHGTRVGWHRAYIAIAASCPARARAALLSLHYGMGAQLKPEVLHTTAGDLPVEEVELDIEGRTWTIRHTGAVVSREQEREFLLGESATKRPYGVMLWPAAIALSHEVASRDVAGKRVLELGAGTGLPGLVAASLGARVVQTDRQNLVLHVCKQNAARNGVTTVEHRIADWTAWQDADRYDVILGSDILYAAPLHPNLRHIFETNLAPNGTVLLADPFREASLRLLELMELDGWRIKMDKWTVGVAPPPRPIGVYALTRL